MHACCRSGRRYQIRSHDRYPSTIQNRIIFYRWFDDKNKITITPYERHIFFFCVTVIVLIVTKHIQVTYENTTRVYQNNDDWCVVKFVVLFRSKAKRIYVCRGQDTMPQDNEFQYRCNVGIKHYNIIIHVGKTILLRPINMRLYRSRNENKYYATEED